MGTAARRFLLRGSGLAALAVAGWAGLALVGESSAAPRKFQAKQCADCHTDFAQRFRSMRVLHPGVKDGSCESCHLRHGLVPKLLLKKDGNALCTECHSPASLGLDKPHVHGALEGAKCTDCHDPHGSPGEHLLKAAGVENCYTCHDRAPYERPVVHEVLKTDGCAACHASHSADQANLLVAEPTQLCLTCHAGKDAEFRKAHEGYPVERSGCTGCHDPHSSGLGGLMKASAHAPVLDA